MRVFDRSPGLTIAAEISSIGNLNLTCKCCAPEYWLYCSCSVPLFRDEEQHNFETQKICVLFSTAKIAFGGFLRAILSNQVDTRS